MYYNIKNNNKRHIILMLGSPRRGICGLGLGSHNNHIATTIYHSTLRKPGRQAGGRMDGWMDGDNRTVCIDLYTIRALRGNCVILTFYLFEPVNTTYLSYVHYLLAYWPLLSRAISFNLCSSSFASTKSCNTLLSI